MIAIDQRRVWIEAARVRTLPASLIPVATGATLAYQDHLFSLSITLLAISCAILIQVGTNLANDYFDYRKGADRADRVGFARATSSGLISPEVMIRAASSLFLLAFILGMLLVVRTGWPVFIIGILSITAGVLYTGGPFPLAYNGMGELFVFLFFGFAAVMGTYYVNTLQWSASAAWASVALGSLSSMILVVNNYRDIHSDRRAGKNTLAVLFGETFSRWQFLFLSLLAFSIPVHFFFRESYSIAILLPLLLLPWSAWLIFLFWTETDKKKFNGVLVQTAQFMSFFGILFCTGILLS